MISCFNYCTSYLFIHIHLFNQLPSLISFLTSFVMYSFSITLILTTSHSFIHSVHALISPVPSSILASRLTGSHSWPYARALLSSQVQSWASSCSRYRETSHRGHGQARGKLQAALRLPNPTGRDRHHHTMSSHHQDLPRVRFMTDLASVLSLA